MLEAEGRKPTHELLGRTAGRKAYRANTQPPYPGNMEMEQRIRSYIRWNAMAMVVKANRVEEGIGGHLASYASAATLLEVAFNHFLRGRTDDFAGDLVYLQGHSSPGNLRPRLSGGAAEQRAPRQLPPRAARHPRTFILSPSLAHAGFLAVSDRLDGSGADLRHLPRPFHQISGGPRA
jgi:hypothetical protein